LVSTGTEWNSRKSFHLCACANKPVAIVHLLAFLCVNVIFGQTLSTRRRFLYACTVFDFFAG